MEMTGMLREFKKKRVTRKGEIIKEGVNGNFRLSVFGYFTFKVSN